MSKKQAFGPGGISRLRLYVQFFFFGLLLYGGFFVNALAENQAQHPTIQGKALDLVKLADSASPVVLPNTTCIYQKEGLCRGCSLYFLTDALQWRKPIETWLGTGLLLLLFMLLGGRLWCGWACPLGLISDLFTKLREKLGLPQRRLSRGWREGLVWTKYVLLLAALGIAWASSFDGLEGFRTDTVDPFCQICPARIFAPFFTFDAVCWTNLKNPAGVIFTSLGFLAFALFFVGLFIRRFWCRLCPIGGLSAGFNRSGLVSLVKDGSRCTRCGSCARVCPLDVQRVYEARGRGTVTSFECHLCLRCVEACPEEDCLHFEWLGKKVVGS